MVCVHIHACIACAHTLLLKQKKKATTASFPQTQNPLFEQVVEQEDKRSRGEDLRVAEAVFSHLVVCFSFFFFLLSWHCLLCDFIVNQMSKLIKFAAV